MKPRLPSHIWCLVELPKNFLILTFAWPIAGAWCLRWQVVGSAVMKHNARGSIHNCVLPRQPLNNFM